MSDNTVPATLTPGDAELSQLVEEVINERHPKLLGANIRTFFAIDAPREKWGSVRVSTEMHWWLDPDGVDILLVVNAANWSGHSPAGRKGLVDLYLSMVQRKEGGKTVMETDRGERQLYERVKGSLGLPLRALVRNPMLILETPELAKLRAGLAADVDPVQFEIAFPDEVKERKPRGRRAAARTMSPDEAGEPGSGTAIYRPDPEPPISYYVKQAIADHGPAALRFTTADHHPETLTGVHYFNSPAEAAESGDLAALEYVEEGNVLATIEEALVAEREEWAAGAEKGNGAGE